MNHHTQYLAEEVAEECAAGYVSRREAMRHLALLGFSAASASALLAACGGNDDKQEATGQASSTTGRSTASTTSGGPTTTGPTAATENITYPGKGITVQGVFAAAAGTPKGAVLVIHENRGITDFVRGFTGRLAGSGFSALAVDLLSAQGGTAAISDPATLGAALNENATNRSVDDMKSTLEELQRRVPGAKLGAVGFCFGGNMAWELLKAGDPPPLAAAAPFYGTPGDNPDFSKTKAAVLAVYAGNDTRVNSTQETAKSGLEKARLQYQVKVYPGVGHAFMNNTGQSYNEAQANAAYADLLDWFGKYLR